LIMVEREENVARRQSACVHAEDSGFDTQNHTQKGKKVITCRNISFVKLAAFFSTLLFHSMLNQLLPLL
jgi:hypothetical protein